MILYYLLIIVLLFHIRLHVIIAEMKCFKQWTAIMSGLEGSCEGEVAFLKKMKKVEPENLFMSFIACVFLPLSVFITSIIIIIYFIHSLLVKLSCNINGLDRGEENE